MASLLVSLALAAVVVRGSAITGRAAWREPVVLPPDAVFEATLEDVTRADQPPTVLGRQRLSPVHSLPCAVEIPYDPGRIQPRARYVVRATLQAGKAKWVTRAIVPVLTHGAGSKVELELKRLSAAAAAAVAPPVTAVAPPTGTFEGVVAGADGGGIRNELSLFTDGSFQLRTEPLGKPEGTRDTVGSWVLSSDGRVLALTGLGDALAYLDVRDADHLTVRGAPGSPLPGPGDLDLARAAAPSSVEPRVTVRGLLTYKAAAGSFEECLTGRRLTVAAEGEPTLESVYRRQRTKAGASVLAVVEGRIVPSGGRRSSPAAALVAEKLVEVIPGGSCPPRLETAPLERTYWRLTQIEGVAVAPSESRNRREAHLLFGSDQGRLVGSDGCNAVIGEYAIEGPRISFGKLTGTSRACDASGNPDQAFRRALAGAAAWRTVGPTLELLDGRGQRLARFGASTPPAAASAAGGQRP
ncbi:MAG TPA: YbaY family lipoprotein [Vicinamibacteria bacterium]